MPNNTYEFWNNLWTSPHPVAPIRLWRIWYNYVMMYHMLITDDGGEYPDRCTAKDVLYEVWVSVDDGITFEKLDEYLILAGHPNSFIYKRWYTLTPNLTYLFKVRWKMADVEDWSGFHSQVESVTTLQPPAPPAPPEPIVWDEGTYLYLDCNGQNVTNDIILFNGTTPSNGYTDSVSMAVSNGNWVIEYATAESEYHIGLSERYGSSDATITITPDGTPGNYELHFYLSSKLMTKLNINVTEEEN